MAKQETSTERINWLRAWENIEFRCDPEDSQAIKRIKKGIRVYVRGWLADYNDKHNTAYRFDDLKIVRVSTIPLKYDVSAFLDPPVELGKHENGKPVTLPGEQLVGGHLIPPPPDELSLTISNVNFPIPQPEDEEAEVE